MSAQTRLESARRQKESLMSGRLRITRLTPVTLDTSTLNLVDLDPSDDLIYDDGPFRIKSPSSAVLALNTEGQLLSAQQLVLCLPIAVGRDVQVNDLCTVTDGGLEPGLTGRTYRIAGAFDDSWATEARIPVEGRS